MTDTDVGSCVHGAPWRDHTLSENENGRFIATYSSKEGSHYHILYSPIKKYRCKDCKKVLVSSTSS